MYSEMGVRFATFVDAVSAASAMIPELLEVPVATARVHVLMSCCQAATNTSSDIRVRRGALKALEKIGGRLGMSLESQHGEVMQALLVLVFETRITRQARDAAAAMAPSLGLNDFSTFLGGVLSEMKKPIDGIPSDVSARR